MAVAAAAVPVLFAGVLGAVALLVVEIGGVVVTVASLYWFLARRGVLRWISLGVAIVTPVIVLAVFVRAHLLWVVLFPFPLAIV